jgi:hypothetical protein
MSSQETKEYSLRTYRQGDEMDLVLLFNKVYENFAGFVPRTIDYWKWCIRSRPGVTDESIVVVSSSDKIIGYAAVAIPGGILEFCYDSTYDGRKIVLMLLNWCIDFVTRQGGSLLGLNVPAQDRLVRQVSRELGFTEELFYPLFLRVFDFPRLFKGIVAQISELKEDFDETVLINIARVPSWCDNHVVIRVKEGKMSVMTAEIKTPTITIDSDMSALSSCIFGSTGIFKEVLKGRLKIRPFWKIPMAIKLFSLLQLKAPWYVPKADL